MKFVRPTESLQQFSYLLVSVAVFGVWRHTDWTLLGESSLAYVQPRLGLQPILQISPGPKLEPGEQRTCTWVESLRPGEVVTHKRVGYCVDCKLARGTRELTLEPARNEGEHHGRQRLRRSLITSRYSAMQLRQFIG